MFSHMGIHPRGLWSTRVNLAFKNLRVPCDGRGQFQYVNGHHYTYGTDGDVAIVGSIAMLPLILPSFLATRPRA
jgi:hypothetical protein